MHNISVNNRAKHKLHVSRNDVIFNVMFCFDEAVNLYVVLNFWGMYVDTHIYIITKLYIV